MENKQNIKKSQKKTTQTCEKPVKTNTTGSSSKKKKKSNRKNSSKGDGNKDSDPSPDNLEIEGIGVLDHSQPGKRKEIKNLIICRISHSATEKIAV